MGFIYSVLSFTEGIVGGGGWSLWTFQIRNSCFHISVNWSELNILSSQEVILYFYKSWAALSKSEDVLCSRENNVRSLEGWKKSNINNVDVKAT